jgi:beta-lactamase regulating signal transducer with metallopeptidase domain
MTLRVWLGVEPNFVAIVLTLSFTYALHALVWGGAALVALSSKVSAPSTRNRLWKLSLLGPCATAPIGALAPWSFGEIGATQVVSLTTTSSAMTAVTARAISTHAWASWLALGVLVAASVGLVRFSIALIRLRSCLRSRTPVRDARVLQQLEHLRARTRCSSLLLTESTEIRSPLVIGVRELCVPSALLQALGDAELAAVLGHELAHLERRDGVWFPIAGFLQSVLWMQPLNQWIAARFRETAELACDDRAVELTGDRMSLARALLEVAQKALAVDHGELVPTMAGSASVLRSRVQRLTQSVRAPLTAARAPERGSVLASLAVCAIASLSSSVRVAGSDQAESSASRRGAAMERSVSSGTRLDALLRRDLELQTQLQHAESWSEDHRDDHEFAAWKSELEQQLRHVRAEATWIEHRSESDSRP